MGKGTLKQRIRRNLIYLLKTSEPIALKYSEEEKKMYFYKIETLSHFPLLHNAPLNRIEFDDQIQELKEMVSIHAQDKELQQYYLIVAKTNDLIKQLHKRKSKR